MNITAKLQNTQPTYLHKNSLYRIVLILTRSWKNGASEKPCGLGILQLLQNFFRIFAR